MLKEIEELERALAEVKAKYKSSQKSSIIKPEFEAFEVYSKDLEGRFTWAEAKEACEALGAGWRLPTKIELNEILKQKNVFGVFSLNYWCSTENDFSNAWTQNFHHVNQNINNKSTCSYVRAVRTLTI